SVEAALLAQLAERDIRSVSVVGFSMVAYPSLNLPLSGRITVERVVLIAGLAGPAQADREPMRQMASMIAALPDFGAPAFRAMFVQRMLAPTFLADHPETGASVAAWLDATTPAILAAEFRAMAEAEDLMPRLPGLAAKLHAIVGESDLASPPALSRQICAAVPGAQLS